MLKTSFLLILALSFTVVPCAGIARSQQPSSDRKLTETKGDVLKRGTGEKARVRIKLNSGRTIKGYIGSAGDDSFTVIDSKSGVSTTVAYGEVARVQGQGISKLTKIAILSGIGLAAVVIVGVESVRHIDFPDGIVIR